MTQLIFNWFKILCFWLLFLIHATGGMMIWWYWLIKLIHKIYPHATCILHTSSIQDHNCRWHVGLTPHYETGKEQDADIENGKFEYFGLVLCIFLLFNIKTLFWLNKINGCLNRIQVSIKLHGALQSKLFTYIQSMNKLQLETAAVTDSTARMRRQWNKIVWYFAGVICDADMTRVCDSYLLRPFMRAEWVDVEDEICF